MNFINDKGEGITREQVKDLWNKGKIKRLPLNFGNINLFHEEILFYLGLKDGYQWLMNRNRAVVKKSYKGFMNPETNEIQRARLLYDIARYDMIPQAIIGFFGNGELPKDLQDWKPTFGVEWQLKSMEHIPNSDMNGNSYWYSQVTRLYQEQLVRSTAPRVKDIEMAVVENESLMISYGGTSNIYKFSELPQFCDKRGKKGFPNDVAHMMIDLSNDIDGCLKQNNPYHKTFGKISKEGIEQSSKHISKLSKAFDSIIQTDDQIGKATDRWFKVNKHRDKMWTPRFILKSSRTTEEKEIIRKAIKKNHTVSKLAENMDKEAYGNKWKKVEDREEMSFEVKSEKQMGLDDWKADKEMDFSD